MKKLIALCVSSFAMVTACGSGATEVETGTVPGDNVAPTISISESTPLTLEYGSNEPHWIKYFSVLDSVDGIISIDDYMIEEDVDTNKIGTYYVTLRVQDKSQNRASKTFKVNVVDTLAPFITLRGDAQVRFEYQEMLPNFLDYFKFEDNVGGNISPKVEMITHDIDINTLGFYTLTATISDGSGNTRTLRIPITISDSTSPDVEVDMIPEVVLSDNMFDVKDYITITDNFDQDIPVTNEMMDIIADVETVGQYNITLTVTDSNANTSIALFSVIVVDNTSPMIEIDIMEETTFEVGDTMPTIADYFIISDNYYALNELDITYFESINMMVAGSYLIEATVVDPSGNSVTESVTITVEELEEGLETFFTANDMTNIVVEIDGAANPWFVSSRYRASDKLAEQFSSINLLPVNIIDGETEDMMYEVDLDVSKLFGYGDDLYGEGKFNSTTDEFELEYTLEVDGDEYEATMIEISVSLYDSNNDNIDDMLRIYQEINFDVDGKDYIIKSLSENNKTTTLAYIMDDMVMEDMNIVKTYAYNENYLIWYDDMDDNPTWTVIIPTLDTYIGPIHKDNISELEHAEWIEWMETMSSIETWEFSSDTVDMNY